MLLENKSWQDIEKYLKKDNSIIIPIGSIEQHSPAMPLGTDTLIAKNLAEEVGERNKTLVSYVLSPGISLKPHMEFKGTISFMPNTFTIMIREYIESLYHHGFRKFLIINGHGGNDGAIKNAITELCFKLKDAKFQSVNWWRMEDVVKKAKALFGHSIGHACATEASLLLHINNTLINVDKFAKEFKSLLFDVSNNLSKKYVTKEGIINSDQTKASKKIGKELFEIVIKNYSKILKDMKTI